MSIFAKIGAGVAGVIIIGLAIALLITQSSADRWRKMYVQEAANHAVDLANVRTATEKARSDDLANAVAVKARDDAIAKDAQHDLETKLASARADAAAYAARLRAVSGSGQGGVRTASDTAVADATGAASRTGQGSELDDAIACAEAVTKAIGWQNWWAKVSADPR